MDKQSKKDLKKQYKTEDKQKSLTKLLDSEYSWVRNYARLELGNSLPPVTKNEIDEADNGFDLTVQLYYKILEVASKSVPTNTSLFGQKLEEAINELSDYLQAIYLTHLFESTLGVGDIDKQFSYYSDLEKVDLEQTLDKLKKAYNLMGCEQMIKLIRRAERTQDYDDLQEISKIYNPKEVDEKRLRFIKDNWREFIIK